MPKYLLLKHYRGGPENVRDCPPLDEWPPEAFEAHIAFQGQVNDMLRENGEWLDAQGLTPERVYVRYGGPDAAPVVTDGPHPETADLIAGWFAIDVDSRERALEVAAYASSEPAHDGRPMLEWIEVRQMFDSIPEDE